MILPYGTILETLRSGPKTIEELQEVDKEGDTVESVLCLICRGLIHFVDGKYVRDEEAVRRDQGAGQ